MSEADESEFSNILEGLAEEFTQRLRNGDRPDIESYVNRYPEQAELIRDALEALMLMERLAPNDESSRKQSLPENTPLLNSNVPQLGDYLILREIGRGGMGIVYEAEQLSLGRHVALKVISHATTNSDIALQRFRREAKAAAKLHHSNIVPIFGVGQQKGFDYYAMQYIQGESLAEVLKELKRLRPEILERSDTLREREAPNNEREKTVFDQSQATRGPISLFDEPSLGEGLVSGRLFVQSSIPAIEESSSDPSSREKATIPVKPDGSSSHGSLRWNTHPTYWQSVAIIGSQVASALDYAHRNGIFHRDIKPANLLLDHRGTIWVTDFGLAKTQEESDLTLTGDVLGTLRYMAPENLSGTTDQRTEIFSLGLTLYELCALSPAYDESHRSTLIERVRQGSIQPLSSICKNAPIDLIKIIHKCLEFEPSHRYATAGEVEEDLKRFLKGEPVLARPTSLSERMVRWGKRNKPLAASLLVAFVLMSLLMVGSLSTAIYLSRIVEEKERLAEQAEISRKDSDKAKELAIKERNQANAAKELVQDLKEKADQARELAETARDSALFLSYCAAMQQATRIAINSPRNSVVRRAVHAWREPRMRFDPRNWEWHWLQSIQQTEEQLMFGHTYDVRNVSFHPTEPMMASVGVADGVRLWNTQTGRERMYLPMALGVFGQWTPDAKKFFALSAKGQIKIIDFEQKTLFTRDLLVDVDAFAWSQDGKKIAIGNTQRIVAYDFASFKIIAETVVTGKATDLQWDNDGNQLAAAIGNEILIYDHQLKNTKQLVGHSQSVRSVAWLDGDRLLSLSTDGTLRTWNVPDESQTSVVACEASKDASGAAWDKTKERVAISSSKKVEICNVASGEAIASWHPYSRFFDGYARSIAWSPDQRYVAAAQSGVTTPVSLWNVEESEPLPLRDAVLPMARIERDIGPRNTMTWSRNGQQIAAFNGSVSVWRYDDRQKIAEFEVSNPRVCYCLRFSPDGQYLACASDDLWVWSLPDQRLVLRNRPLKGGTFSFAWKNDSRTLAVGGIEGDLVQMVDVVTGVSTPTSLPFNYCSSLEWHPAKPYLMVGGKGADVGWNEQTGKYDLIFPTEHYNENLIRCSPDGARVARVLTNGVIQVDSIQTQGQKGIKFDGHGVSVYGSSWSPDGKRIASVDKSGKLEVWDSESGTRVMELEVQASNVEWSPTLPVLAFSTADGEIRFLDASRSYRWESSVETSWMDLVQESEDRAVAMARKGDWEGIPERFSDRDWMQLGWWIVRPQEMSDYIKLRDAAFANSDGSMKRPLWFPSLLNWYHPSKTANGSVRCLPRYRHYCSPIYVHQSQTVALIEGGNARIANLTLNGKALEQREERLPWRIKRPITLQPGWNMLEVEVKESSPTEVYFFDLLLSNDPGDLELAQVEEEIQKWRPKAENLSKDVRADVRTMSESDVRAKLMELLQKSNVGHFAPFQATDDRPK